MAQLPRPSRPAGISAGLGSEANTARKLAAMSSISVQVDRDRGLITVTTLSERKSRTGKVGKRETAVAVSKPYMPPGLPNNVGNHAGGTAD